MIRLASSIYPFMVRCSIEVVLSWICHLLQKCLNCSLMNYLPLSVTKAAEIPKLVIIFWEMNFCIALEMMEARGSASIHLVKWSTTTTKNFICLVVGEKAPKMSVPKYGRAMVIGGGTYPPCESTLIIKSNAFL